MFVSSLWDVKDPKHYSRRVGGKVPGVVAVLFSPAEVAGSAVMSLKRLLVFEVKQKQPLVKKRLCRVLKYVDVDVDVDRNYTELETHVYPRHHAKIAPSGDCI